MSSTNILKEQFSSCFIQIIEEMERVKAMHSSFAEAKVILLSKMKTVQKQKSIGSSAFSVLP